MEVYIGSEASPLIIHKDLACATSRFFREQSQHSKLGLPDEDPALFQVYTEWLYSNHSKAVLKALKAHEIVHGADGVANDQPGAEHLFHLYVLGERLQDAVFKNAVLDAYVDAVVRAQNYPTHFADPVYRLLPADSPFRRLYVDIWVWVSDDMWFKDLDARDDPNTAPGAFWRDVVKREREVGKAVFDARMRPPWVREREQYFEKVVDLEEEEDDEEELVEVLDVLKQETQ